MEPISVLCPSICYALEPGVRLRPVPELGTCLAYLPARRSLHRLNAPSWLLATLCDGRSLEAIEAAYADALRRAGRTPDRQAFLDGLASLMAIGVVGRAIKHSNPEASQQ
jgi:hypothetical protein